MIANLSVRRVADIIEGLPELQIETARVTIGGCALYIAEQNGPIAAAEILYRLADEFCLQRDLRVRP